MAASPTRTGLLLGRVATAGTILLLLALAWSDRFVQDDAFISFRYARNLASGNGLTWNRGERIEGYTNFLWTLLMSISFPLRIDPILFSQLLGMACFAVTLLCTYLIVYGIVHSRWIALSALVLLGTNYTFSSYATGGLETQLQACLVTAGVCVVTRMMTRGSTPPASLVGLSLLTAAAMMTRLDSAVAYAPILVVSGLLIVRRRPLSRITALNLAALLLPVTTILGSWFLWKLSYYHAILPNTFNAKGSTIGSWTTVKRGFQYIYSFALSYWLLPFIFLGLSAARETFRRASAAVLLILSTTLLWLAYVVSVGGDFMEFRFLVPVLPLVFVFITWVLFHFIQRPAAGAGLALMVLAGSAHHAWTYTGARSVESIDDLGGHLGRSNERWVSVGRTLGDLFGAARSGVVIATTAAGAIPYYSDLQTVDMLGLNDAWIARNGPVVSSIPGHQRIAPFEYLLLRKVNLVIGPPYVRAGAGKHRFEFSIDDLERFALHDVTPDKLPGDAEIVEIPVGDGFALFALYLVRSPTVDRAIEAHSLRTCLVSSE